MRLFIKLFENYKKIIFSFPFQASPIVQNSITYAPQKPPSDSELLKKFMVWKFFYIKTECMQEGPRVKKFQIAIQFLGTYVIVMAVSNLPENIEMETSSSISMQKNYETMNF